MPEILIPLETDRYFHIYNHATGDENLFNTHDDYMFFLRKLRKYISPFYDVFAYCLMPNHFHLVIRVKDDSQFRKAFQLLNAKIDLGEMIRKNENFVSNFLSKQFSNFFNTYAKYFNYAYKRKGTLFKRAFRRKLIDDQIYFQKLICYVHQNPVSAGFCARPEQWQYSSYNAILSLGPTMILRNEVIELFDDLSNFIFCNSRSTDLDF